jgi:acetyl-CoA/propionyl-CoA carboxylase carboxyl transferase subunit
MTALDQSPAAALPVALPVMLPRDPQERLAALFDPGSLQILPAEERSGVVAGTGLVHGLSVVAFASDARVQGGAMSTAGCAAIVAAYAEATARGVPIVGLWHSGGARLAEGVASLHAVGTVFAAMTQASGRPRAVPPTVPR